MRLNRFAGLGAIMLALGYNLAFTALAVQFDYPDILREAPAEVLRRLAEGGPGLLLLWEVFALCAVGMVPVALVLGLSETAHRNAGIAAAISGALAGTVQAMGLLRWVFAVPLLSPDAETEFLILHAWGGMAIGEHLGMLLTAVFLAAMAMAAMAARRRIEGWVAALAALLITAGAMESLALALGGAGEPFATLGVVGYVGLSLWLVIAGSRAFRKE